MTQFDKIKTKCGYLKCTLKTQRNSRRKMKLDTPYYTKITRKRS